MGVECRESSSSSTVLGVESTGCWIDPDGLTNLAPGESAFICSLTGVTACPFVMTVMLLLGDDLVFDEVDEADDIVDEGLPNLLRPPWEEEEVVEGWGEVEVGEAVVLIAVTVLAPDSST